jgi:hypothetical protein
MTGRWYGAPAWQLPLLLVGFTVTGWIVARLSGEATAVRMAIWFVAAVVAHDLVLFPLAAAADRTLVAVAGIGGRLRPAVRRAIVNHVRVPALGAALLFLVYLPGILRHGPDPGAVPAPLAAGQRGDVRRQRPAGRRAADAPPRRRRR